MLSRPSQDRTKNIGERATKTDLQLLADLQGTESYEQNLKNVINL